MEAALYILLYIIDTNALKLFDWNLSVVRLHLRWVVSLYRGGRGQSLVMMYVVNCVTAYLFRG